MVQGHKARMMSLRLLSLIPQYTAYNEIPPYVKLHLDLLSNASNLRILMLFQIVFISIHL